MNFMNLSLAINAENLKIDPSQFKKLKTGLDHSEALYKMVHQNRWQIPLLSLGERKKEEKEELVQRAREIIVQHSPFFLKLNGIWAYPHQKEARVLWIAVQNSIELRDLQTNLAAHLIHPHLYREDKPFKPTLPIARIKNHRDVTDIISPYKNTDFGKFKVEQLRLYDMISGGAFPVFEKVADFHLNPHIERTREKETREI